jgi:cyclin-dependent kinase 2
MVVRTREQRNSSATKLVGQITDKYSLLEKIGSGTYGVVYRARDKRTQSVVALKKIKVSRNCEDSDEDGVPSSSLREIGLLKDLKHQNVLRLLDIELCESSLYLVFEHLDLDLKKLLEQYKKGLPCSLVKSYMWQLLHGLAYCHARRVLHRDLKLQNLLVDRLGNIKLADFGLARSIGLPIRTYTHEVVTLWYRSPELLLKTTHYGPSVDLWSLGCIFAEMKTNRTLFPGDSEIDQIYRIFRTLGTPDETTWPDFPNMPEYRQFAKFRSRGVENYIGNHDTLAVDLLSKFLAYDPVTRISARQALEHEYFNDVAENRPTSVAIY